MDPLIAAAAGVLVGVPLGVAWARHAASLWKGGWMREAIAHHRSHPGTVKFHYNARSTLPDIVQVWVQSGTEDVLWGQYSWIDGVEAYPNSVLGKLHAIYESERDSVFGVGCRV